MTRKDYEKFAAIFAQYRQSIRFGHTFKEEEQFDLMINDFMNMFKLDNPNFDKSRFVKATHQ